MYMSNTGIMPEDIAQSLIDKALPRSYRDTINKTSIVNFLDHLNTVCENPYNNDYYRDFYKLLVDITMMDYVPF